MRFAYDKVYLRKADSKSQMQLSDSNDMEHAIAILSEPLRRRKSGSQFWIDRQIRKGKVACTGYGIVNPIKLDISCIKKNS